jgi:thymidylate synthase
MNYGFVVDFPTYEAVRTLDLKRNEVMAKYLATEQQLYYRGVRDAEVWAHEASPIWRQLANPDGTINSNYGWLLFKNRSLPHGRTPWDWACIQLEKDRDTRQAFARLSLPEFQADGVKDQVCTMHLMFMIRNGTLHTTTVMRSNDVVLGLAYDMPWFCLLHAAMAGHTHAERGSYTHFVHSMHLYEHDLDRAEKMLGRMTDAIRVP